MRLLASLGPMGLLLLVSFTGCVSQAPETDASGESANVAAPSAPGHALLVPGNAAVLPAVDRPVFALRGTGFDAFEPTLGVTSTGSIFFVANTDILRSRDLGLTWENVAPNAGGQNVPPTTFDPMLYVDTATDRVYYDHLFLACTYLSYSDDEGQTWIPNPIGCGQPVNDHQTIASGPAVIPAPLYENREFYLCVNNLADAICSVSLDGGHTFPISRPVFFEAKVANCGGITGHVNVGPDGTVYIPSWQCDEAWVGISRDGGNTWEPQRVAPQLSSGAMDPALAVDGENNVYYYWMDLDGASWLSRSVDQGRTWSEPIDVDFPGYVTGTLPTIVAGDPGRIAFSYVATTTGESVNAADVGEGTPWNLYVTLSTDALSETPHFTTVQLNPTDDPVHTGPCSGGYRCGSIVDFFDVTIGPDGRVYVASVDSESGGEGILGVLLEGPSLYAANGWLTDPATA